MFHRWATPSPRVLSSHTSKVSSSGPLFCFCWCLLVCFSWYADVGEFVEADEVVARIETDKVTVDILSSHAGVITKYFAEEGDTVEVGGQFLEIDTDAKAPEGGAPAAAPKQEAPAVSIKKPARTVPRFVNLLIIIQPLISGLYPCARPAPARCSHPCSCCPCCPQARPRWTPGWIDYPADCQEGTHPDHWHPRGDARQNEQDAPDYLSSS